MLVNPENIQHSKEPSCHMNEVAENHVKEMHRVMGYADSNTLRGCKLKQEQEEYGMYKRFKFGI